MLEHATLQELNLDEDGRLPDGFLDSCLAHLGWDRRPSTEYLAGFFDGEGCISIVGARSPILKVFLTNTNEGVLRNVQAGFGGRFELKSRRQKEHWKPSFALTWDGWRAASLLERMMPHLVVKISQASLGLEFWKFSRLPLKERCSIRLVECGQPRRVKTEKTKRLEVDFMQRMHELNRRGVQ